MRRGVAMRTGQSGDFLGFNRARSVTSLFLATAVALAGALSAPASASAEPEAAASTAASTTVSGDGSTVTYVDASLEQAPSVSLSGILSIATTDFAAGDQLESRLLYAVADDEGRVIPLDLTLPETVVFGSTFDGEIELTRAQGKTFDVDAGETVDGDSVKGERIVAALSKAGDTRGVVESTIVAPAAAARPTAKNHRAFVAVVAPAGGSNAISDVDATAVVNRAAEYWQDQSNGAIPGFTVTPTVARYTSTGDCTMSAWARWAEAESKFGLSPSASEHVVVLLPEVCEPAQGLGLGEIGAGIHSSGNVQVSLGFSPVMTVVHEFGHNMALGHAGTSTCVDCEWDEYTDPFSPMGFAVQPDVATALDATYQVDLGIVESGELQTVAAASTLVIKPISSGDGLRILRIEDPQNGRVYFIELRSGTGRDAGSFYTGSACSIKFLVTSCLLSTPGVRVLTVDDEAASGAVQSRALVHDAPRYREVWLKGEAFVGKSITVTVDDLASDFSSATVRVGFDPVTSVTASTPTISGVPQIGQTLTGDPGAWQSGAQLSYQWLRDGAPISGASGNTRLLAAEDVATRVSLQVTGSIAGSTASTRVSTPTARIRAGDLSWPNAVRLPSRVTVGTAISPEFLGEWGPGPVDLSFEWRAGGSGIPGATNASYTPTDGDIGRSIMLRVTGSKAGFDTRYIETPSATVVAAPVVSTSAVQTPATADASPPPAIAPPIAPVKSTAVVKKRAFASPPRPRVIGTAKVGAKLTAVTGKWRVSGVAFAYQWFANGKAIKKATKASYPIPKSAQGKKITVRVVAQKTGYTTVAMKSAATKNVKAKR